MNIGKTLFIGGLALAAAISWAQDKKDPRQIEQRLEQNLATWTPARGGSDAGKLEYENSCALCHGLTGKGFGPYSDSLKLSPPDLTMLSKRNGGAFPLAQVYSIIDGAKASHGTREMPIWGQRYSLEAAAYFVDVDHNREAFVRGRILSLVDYLNRLQQR